MSEHPVTPAHLAWLLPMSTLGLMLGVWLGRAAEQVWMIVSLICLGIIASVISSGWRRTFAVLVIATGVGAGVGFMAYHPDVPEEGKYRITGTIMQAVDFREDGRIRTILRGVTLDGEAAGDAYWTAYLDAADCPDGLIPGATVAFTARVYEPDGASNPGGFDFREYLLQRGVTIGVFGADNLTVTGSDRTMPGRMASLRHHLSLRLMDVMGQEHGAYAAAMLLGDREFISEDDNEAFRKLGIAHILSVSGYHVGVLAALLVLMLRPMHLSRPVRMVAEGGVLLLYCLLTGGNAPVIRASLLLIWREISLLRYRSIEPLHILSVTATLQILFMPPVLMSASFQLTYGAMLGMLLIRPRLAWLLHPRTRAGCRLWDAFVAALSAQIGILLPQLYWFGDLPVFSVAFNMVLMVVASALMTCYWFTLAALPIPALRDVLGAISSCMTELLLAAVRFLAKWDFTSLWTRQADLFTAVGWVLLMLGLSGVIPNRWRKRRRALCVLGALLLLMILLPLPQTGTTYLQLDVGDADCALIVDEGFTVLIDTGEDGGQINSLLHKRRERIDVLILTHLHTDHAGGLQTLIDGGISIGVCCLPSGAFNSNPDEILLPMLDNLRDTGTEIHFLHRGDEIRLPSGALTVAWPMENQTSPRNDANDTPLVLYASLKGVTMLLTSDLTGEYERYIQVPADILKVAHHGSKQSTTDAFLTAVDPQILLLSNADVSRQRRIRGLVSDEILYDTAANGALLIEFDGDGQFTVRPTFR